MRVCWLATLATLATPFPLCLWHFLLRSNNS